MPQSYHTEFFTATILEWRHLLKDDHCKETITNSLQWLVNKKRCSVYAFVIMPNHIHLLWKIADGFEREEVQGVYPVKHYTEIYEARKLAGMRVDRNSDFDFWVHPTIKPSMCLPAKSDRYRGKFNEKEMVAIPIYYGDV